MELAARARATGRRTDRPTAGDDACAHHGLNRPGSMGVCEKPPTMDFDLFVDLFFIVRPPA